MGDLGRPSPNQSARGRGRCAHRDRGAPSWTCHRQGPGQACHSTSDQGTGSSKLISFQWHGHPETTMWNGYICRSHLENASHLPTAFIKDDKSPGEYEDREYVGQVQRGCVCKRSEGSGQWGVWACGEGTSDGDRSASKWESRARG